MPSASVTVAAPAERVWDLVADVTQMGRWSPETTGAAWVGGATGPAVGARFKGSNRRKAPWSTTCTVTACERGRSFAFSVGKGETTWAYDLEPVGGGCELTESFAIVRAPGVVGRWLTRMAVGVPWARREADLLAGVEETLRRLKAAAEAGEGSAADSSTRDGTAPQ